MPNTFLHAEADEPIQAAALLGHLRLGLVRVCYVVKNKKEQSLEDFSFHCMRLLHRHIEKKRIKKYQPSNHLDWIL